ncbi:MAG: sulfite exporter TauE/SafE family protein [Gammaproteobacteria bacterium]|nr:sulfite exporter TauE/SafE family protein [Gammaproteobacteria bacterium]
MFLEAGLIISGILISAAAMTIGIGGGILWTPMLILAYNLSPQEAIATSLLIQVVGMGSGSIAYYRAGITNIKLSLIFIAVALPGVIIGSFITINLEQSTVQMALGIMSMMLAILFVNSHDDINQGHSFNFSKKVILKLLPIPAFFGFILGTLSLGIGEWLIPSLRSKLKIDMTTAVATVIPVMFVLVTIASLIHWSFAEDFHLQYFLWGALGTFIGGQIGVHISKRVDERMLKQSFIYLMTLIGIHLIFQAV